MKKSIKKLFFPLLLVSLVLSSIPLQASRMSSQVNIPYTKSQCELQKAEQKLWIDHVSWTRSYIISAIASLPDQNDKLWHQNADKIAEFLSSANPNYSLNDLKDMLYQHLKYLTDQVVARLSNDWKADIDAYDKGEEHMIHFADGIIKQFPEKFK